MLSAINFRSLPTTKKMFNAEVKEIATHVSECLNNTPGVCKKSYTDDRLFQHRLSNRLNNNKNLKK